MTPALKDILLNNNFFELEQNKFSKIILKNYYNSITIQKNKFKKYVINIVDEEFNINEEHVLNTEEQVLNLLKIT